MPSILWSINSPVIIVSDVELSRKVRQQRECLSKLSPEEQAILVGIFFYDQSARELAGRLGVSASAVGYRKQKALQKLKLALTER